MEELLLRAGVVLRTSNLKIPRRRLTVCEKEIYLNTLRTWRVIIFPHSFNHIIDWWRWRCRYHLSNSLVWQIMTRMAKKCTHEQYGNRPCSYPHSQSTKFCCLKINRCFHLLLLSWRLFRCWIQQRDLVVTNAEDFRLWRVISFMKVLPWVANLKIGAIIAVEGN